MLHENRKLTEKSLCTKDKEDYIFHSFLLLHIKSKLLIQHI